VGTLFDPLSCTKKHCFLEVKREMADRTFSADDVLRIYEFFLDSTEQKTVEMFFAELEEPEEEEEPIFTVDELKIITGLIRQLFGPARSILTFVFSNLFFFTVAASTIQFVLERLEIILDDLLGRGVIDA